MAKKKWMKQAFANSHGQFKAKAERTGKSTAAYAKEHEHDKGRLGRQARLAKVGMKVHHSSHSKIRKDLYG